MTSNMVYDDIQLLDGGQRGCPPLYLLFHSLDIDMKGFAVVSVVAVEVHESRTINAVYSTMSRAMNSVEYTGREGIEWRVFLLKSTTHRSWQ